MLVKTMMLAYYDDIVVGGVCCRVEDTDDDNVQAVYIMTLACLASYRRLGIGSMMLEHVKKLAEKNPKVNYIYLYDVSLDHRVLM